MATKQEFSKFMFALAKAIPRHAPQIDNQMAETWYLPFKAFDINALENIVVQAMMEFDQFPSIRELLALVGATLPSARDEAILIADTIINGISRYGEITHIKAAVAVETSIGPSAWQVVCQQGGWNLVVERASENLGVLKAQLRDAAEAYLRTGRLERGKVPEQLPTHSDALAEAASHPTVIAIQGDERLRALEAGKAKLEQTLALLDRHEASEQPW